MVDRGKGALIGVILLLAGLWYIGLSTDEFSMAEDYCERDCSMLELF